MAPERLRGLARVTRPGAPLRYGITSQQGPDVRYEFQVSDGTRFEDERDEPQTVGAGTALS